MSEYFTSEAVNTGYTQVPHGLWNAPGLTYGTRCLLGWLHSHSPQYLAKLSVAKCLEQFGVSDSEGRKMLNQLVAAGYVTTVKQARGRLEVRLIAEPWLKLHRTVESRTPETGEVTVAEEPSVPVTGIQSVPETGTPIEEHPEKNIIHAPVPSEPTRAAVAETAKARGRQPDELFDAMTEVCGIQPCELTKSIRGQANRALKELREVGATADEVFRRAEVYQSMYPNNTLTPAALSKHWPMLRELRTPTAPQRNTVMDRVRAQLAAEKQKPSNVVALRAVGE